MAVDRYQHHSCVRSNLMRKCRNGLNGRASSGPNCHNVVDGLSNFVSPACEGFTDPHEENHSSVFHNDHTHTTILVGSVYPALCSTERKILTNRKGRSDKILKLDSRTSSLHRIHFQQSSNLNSKIHINSWK